MSTQPCIFEVLDMFLQQIFSSLEIRLNASSKSWKSLYIKHFYTFISQPLTSIQPSQRECSIPVRTNTTLCFNYSIILVLTNAFFKYLFNIFTKKTKRAAIKATLFLCLKIKFYTNCFALPIAINPHPYTIIKIILRYQCITIVAMPYA